MRTAVAHANATMPTACLAAKAATTTAAAGTVCSSHRAAARRSNPGDPDTGPGAARGSSSGFVASRVRIPSAVVWVSTRRSSRLMARRRSRSARSPPRTARSGVRIPSDASFAGVARSKTRSEATPRMPRPSPVAPGERRRARDEDAGSDRGERGAFGEASAPRDASAATTASASPPRALCSWSRVRSAEPRRESARTTRGPVPRSASATSGGGSEAEADDRTREPSETSAPRSTSSTGVSPPLGDIPPWLICARDPRARGGVTCGRASGVVTRTARVERPDERSAMHTAPQKGDSSSDENHGCRPTNFVGVGPAGQISYRSL